MTASAGSLDAYPEATPPMPSDLGAAFVLVPHLAPTSSHMVELLAASTPMPVTWAADRARLEAVRVYVIHNRVLPTILDGHLSLNEPSPPSVLPIAIDCLFGALARSFGERAIGVVLSGTGGYGTRGLADIRSHGGLAVAQDPATCSFGQMPASAVAAGATDLVMPLERMPGAIADYLRSLEGAAAPPDEDASALASGALDAIVARLREGGHDFAFYKRPMMLRRVRRRMGLSGVGDLAAYTARIASDPEELQRLAKDLLIGVTRLFRDPDAFEDIAPVTAARIASLGEAPFRAWVVGCSTGEEAYSLAILLLEQLAAVGRPDALRLFATDIDEAALAIARQGVFPNSQLVDLDADRLRRFFRPEGDKHHRVSDSLRDAIVFSKQNLVADPPFSRLDLISCRNLLIYLQPELQKRLIRLFHFALSEGGILFLGSSETVGLQGELFEPISKKWRIFRRVGPVTRRAASFPSRPSTASMVPWTSSVAPPSRRQTMAELTQRTLLGRAPPSVLINRKGEVLYSHGDTSSFLELPTGEPSHDLLALARPSLRSRLRTGLRRAVESDAGVVVITSGMRLGKRGGRDGTRVRFVPVGDAPGGERLWLVSFERLPAPERGSVPDGDHAVIAQLESELREVYDDLASTATQMEVTNEDLRLSNEEMLSMNEELQSLNEEQESSREELQSFNEELNSVNAQLEEKVEELDRARDDLANIITSMDVATIILAPDGVIRRFTPAATRLMGLIVSDVGRPLSDIAGRQIADGVLDDAARVLADGTPIEREVSTSDERVLLRRVVPYRSAHGELGGTVVTFVDITNLSRATARLRLLATVLRDSNDAIIIEDLEGRVTAWNRGAQLSYGYSEAEILGGSMRRLMSPIAWERHQSLLERVARGDQVEPFEEGRVTKDGQRVDVAVTATLVRDERGRGVAVATTERDVTQRARLEARLARFSEAASDGNIIIDEAGRIESVNPAVERIFGYPASALVGENVKTLMPEPTRAAHDGYLAAYARTGKKAIIDASREVLGRRADGSSVPVLLSVSEMQLGGRRIFAGIIHDLTTFNELRERTQRVEHLAQIGEMSAAIAHEIKNPLAGISGVIQVMRQRTSPDDVSQPVLDIVQENIARIDRVVRDLMAFSRTWVPRPVVTDLRAVAERVVLGFATVARAHEIGLELLPVASPPMALVDPDHLNQVLLNLVSNACEATPRGGSIRIAFHNSPGAVAMTVSDSGPGIPPEMLQNLFKPFHSSKVRGTGLGLATSRRIVEANGGNISIGSREGEGTTVTLSFPPAPRASA
ncbi:MAG: PAS domain S-box protein [Myxococcota bacterium]